MFRTKEGVKWPLSRAARIVTPGLFLAAVGCADTNGLRSIWSDRPSLLGFRDHQQQPSPDPANDYYTRYMRAARERSDALAKRSRDEDTSHEQDRSEPPGPDDTLVAQGTEAPPASRPDRRSSGPSGRPTRDETIRVTLGNPEPLPVMPGPADATLASAPSPSRDTDRGTSRISTGRIPAPTPDRQAEEHPQSVMVATTPAPRRPAPQPSRSGPSSKEARAILARSEAKLRSLGTYQVKMSRVERIDGRLQPEEEVILSIHRQPKEVRLQWASGPSQGREVIYSTRVDDRSLFVHMPKSAIPLPTMKMAIDSPMVARSSRHSITEAGFDTIIENLRKSVDQVDAANAAQGRAAYRGVEKPSDLDRPSHVFTRRSPNGETWTVFLDARTLFPSMVVAKDASGQLDEKYIYHEVSENPPELASLDAFDPDKRWGEPKGLLSRFARGGSSPASPGTGQSTVR
jgi:Protein of unknown function (DUF1571)